MTRTQFVYIFIIPFLILFIIGLVYLHNPAPKDKELENRFFANRTDFEKLVCLVQADSNLKRFSTSYDGQLDYKSRSNLSEDRIKAYEELMGKLQIQEISRWDQGNTVYFQVWWTSHLVIGNKSKYYVYLENPPEKLVDSLDIRVGNNDANDYKKIEANWYLHLDIW